MRAIDGAASPTPCDSACAAVPRQAYALAASLRTTRMLAQARLARFDSAAGRRRKSRAGLATALLLALAASPMQPVHAAEHYDIRLDAEKPAVTTLERLRGPEGAKALADASRSMQAARAALAARMPGLVVVDSPETGGPEVVAPPRGKRALTAPSDAPRERIARTFVESHAALYGLTDEQAASLRLDADYTNPAGNLSWVRLVQEVHGVPVFRSELTVALSPRGEVVRTIGQLAVGIREASAAVEPAIDAASALVLAGDAVGAPIRRAGVAAAKGADDGRALQFTVAGSEVSQAEASLLYFPIGGGALELAWSYALWTADSAHQVIVGASDGTVLFRKNATEHLGYAYRVYEDGSPSPLRPGATDPTLGLQGLRVLPTDVLVESQITSMPSADNPWLPVGATTLTGNNAEAGLDLVAPDGIDATVPLSGPNAFLYSANPPPGLPPPGDPPGVPSMRNAAVVNLFYWVNRFHDLTYDLGFTEPARNYQTDNYGRGGVGGDSIRAEAQDHSGTNNANFGAFADGTRGRLQMYAWTGPAVDRDSAFDADIILHELTHGLSQRLHGNASGLTGTMAGGLGQGWSKFYPHALLAQAGDPLQGVYPLAGYTTLEVVAGFTGNYYYGIQRFPLAVLSFEGGPGTLPHNPLTFADIDPTQMSLTDGAFPRGPVGPAAAFQVHNIGEVWASMLWEARARVIDAMGFAAGNQRMLQLVTDGMKLDPLNPTFLQARDAIIAADCAAFGGGSQLDLMEGFAARGLGFDAQILDAATGRVVESFAGPTADNVVADLGTITTERVPLCPVPGSSPLPGETVLVRVPVTNPYCGFSLTGVSASVPGDSAALGTLGPGQTVEAVLEYPVPDEATCGTSVAVQVTVSNDMGTQQVAVDIPVLAGATETFSNATPIAIPGVDTSGPAAPYPSSIMVAGVVAPVVGLKVRLNGLSHTFPGDIDVLLVGPTGQAMVLLSDAFGTTDAAGLTLEIADDAASAAPTSIGALPSPQAFRPTNHTDGDPFAVPAPAAGHLDPEPVGVATLASFAGLDPNGTWSLYVVDDAAGDVGSISNGWTLELLLDTGCPICTTAIFADGFE